MTETLPPRAVRAAEAGELLATLLGLNDPIPPARMWYLARLNLVRTVRVGRLRYFRTPDLEQFVLEGGRGVNGERRSA